MNIQWKKHVCYLIAIKITRGFLKTLEEIGGLDTGVNTCTMVLTLYVESSLTDKGIPWGFIGRNAWKSAGVLLSCDTENMKVAPLLKAPAGGDYRFVVVGPAEHYVLAIGHITTQQDFRALDHIHVFRFGTEVKRVLWQNCKTEQKKKKSNALLILLGFFIWEFFFKFSVKANFINSINVLEKRMWKNSCSFEDQHSCSNLSA